MIKKKRCSRCGQMKLIDDFHMNRDMKDGRHYYCKGCMRKYLKKYYTKNRKKELMRVKVYYKEHREEIRRYMKGYRKEYNINHCETIRRCQKEYYAKNRVGIRKYMKEYGKEYFVKNREYFKRYMKEYFVKNRVNLMRRMKEYNIEHREKILRYMKGYYTNHREERLRYGKEYLQEYYKLNPGKFKMYQQVRHHRMRNGGDLALKTVQRVYENNIGLYGVLTCEYDKEPIQFGNDSLDHKIPLSRGGTNEYDNLCIACIRCNSEKYTKTDKEFMKLLNEKGGEVVATKT